MDARGNSRSAKIQRNRSFNISEDKVREKLAPGLFFSAQESHGKTEAVPAHLLNLFLNIQKPTNMCLRCRRIEFRIHLDFPFRSAGKVAGRRRTVHAHHVKDGNDAVQNKCADEIWNTMRDTRYFCRISL